ncbi:MAG: hypothetical protein OK457_01650 [Thaumarchaeota archaeon]|nr:hypothetical protein [Nitrososphaerota archaeon]
MAIDTLIFRDDGKPSFIENPKIHSVGYCRHCKVWHEKLALENGTKFCAFCYTTHHSRACRAGFHEKCTDVSVDPIHEFLTEECNKHQKFDLSFCKECNCFHSKKGWEICLDRNRPAKSWNIARKDIWKLRWDVSTSDEAGSSIKRERSLFNPSEMQKIIPYEYPYSSGRFVHHCNV